MRLTGKQGDRAFVVYLILDIFGVAMYGPFMKLVEVFPEKDFLLFVRYDDGSCGSVDLSDLANRGVFAAWNGPGVFQQVRLSDEGHPEWPGEIDLCPDSLYMRLTGKPPEQVFPKFQQLSVHA